MRGRLNTAKMTALLSLTNITNNSNIVVEKKTESEDGTGSRHALVVFKEM